MNLCSADEACVGVELTGNYDVNFEFFGHGRLLFSTRSAIVDIHYEFDEDHEDPRPREVKRDNLPPGYETDLLSHDDFYSRCRENCNVLGVDQGTQIRHTSKWSGFQVLQVLEAIEGGTSYNLFGGRRQSPTSLYRAHRVL